MTNEMSEQVYNLEKKNNSHRPSGGATKNIYKNNNSIEVEVSTEEGQSDEPFMEERAGQYLRTSFTDLCSGAAEI